MAFFDELGKVISDKSKEAAKFVMAGGRGNQASMIWLTFL